MSGARFTPTAGPRSDGQGRSVVVVALLSALVATAFLTVVIVPRPAAADQTTDLKAQAREISQEVVREQLQIGADQQQYSVASEKVAADARTVLHIGERISGDERQINGETRRVRNLAIVSYMDAGNALSGSAAVFTGDMETVTLAHEYTSLSAGNIDTALDELHATERILQVHRATLQRAQIVDRTEQTARAADLGRASSTEHQMEAEQALVTGQLATAVAHQAAVSAAAAAAAVAAARKTATEAAVTAAASASVSVSVADPVLSPYLQCVVQAESGGNYGAVSPNGVYRGAFQISQATWDMAASAAGLSALVGVPPNLASKADQDAVAVALYALDGEQPWLGDRCQS